MPFDARARSLRMTGTELRLPPPFRLVRLREWGDAYEHAKRVAAQAGAGTLAHVGRFDLAEFALVLEPDEPLARARRAFYAGMAALAGALASHAQPESLIEIKWPGALTVNLGLVGGGRLAWPEGTAETDVPDWLVFGGMIRTAGTDAQPELEPDVTALAEEGFLDIGAENLVESFARNMMLHLDAWREDGFDSVARSYLARLVQTGDLPAIDGNGDLMLRSPGRNKTERRELVPALASDDWTLTGSQLRRPEAAT